MPSSGQMVTMARLSTINSINHRHAMFEKLIGSKLRRPLSRQIDANRRKNPYSKNRISQKLATYCLYIIPYSLPREGALRHSQKKFCFLMHAHIASSLLFRSGCCSQFAARQTFFTLAENAILAITADFRIQGFINRKNPV